MSPFAGLDLLIDFLKIYCFLTYAQHFSISSAQTYLRQKVKAAFAARREVLDYNTTQNSPFPVEKKPIILQEKKHLSNGLFKAFKKSLLLQKLSRKLEKMKTNTSFIPVVMKADLKKD